MKYRFNRFPLTAILAALAIGVVPATHAASIYSTLGSGGAFDANNFVQFGTFGPSFSTYADEFASPVTATVGSVSLPLEAAVFRTPPTIVVSLWSSTANAPGTILMSFSPGVIPVAPGAAMDTFTSTTPIQLDAGTQYWLSVTPVGSLEDILWYFNNQGIDHVTATRSVSTWTVNGSGTALAFELDPVPEPSSAALCAMSFVAAYLWRKMNKRHAALPCASKRTLRPGGNYASIVP